MAAISNSIPHIVRTAKDPRQEGLLDARVSQVEEVNSSVRLIKLELPSTGVGSVACHRVFDVMARHRYASIASPCLCLTVSGYECHM